MEEQKVAVKGLSVAETIALLKKSIPPPPCTITKFCEENKEEANGNDTE